MTRATAARALVAAVAVGAATLGAVAPASAGTGPTTSPASRDTVRVIVTYDSLASTRAVAGSVDRVGTVTATLKRSAHLVATVPAADVAALRRSPHVRSVQLDVPQKLTAATNLGVIRADVAHTSGFTGTGTTVAILDTGVDVDHPYLGGRVIAQFCSSTPDGPSEQSLCPDGTTEDDSADTDHLAACFSASLGTLCDHGTHVAGIAAGNGSGVAGAPVAGVAPGANIIAMQVFTRFNDSMFCGASSCVASYPSDQMRALDELAALDTAHPSWNIVSANMSLGGGSSGTACDTDARKVPIDTLLAQGVATVIAAGNSYSSSTVSYPGCISSAVTVGATDNRDVVASFGNRGRLLDVFAPGVGIGSSVPDDGWESLSGTSMAAPHVAGALALLRQHAPSRPIASLVQDLRTSGRPLTYPSGSGHATTPRIDVLAAIQPRLATTVAPVSTPEGSPATAKGTWSASGDGVTLTASTGTVTQGTGTWSWTATLGDDTTLPVTITATDAGGASRSVALTARWVNVAPTAALTSAGTTPWRGSAVAFTHVGAPTRFALSVTDPGSDDISTSWSFGDGGRGLSRLLLHPPGLDPLPSPSVEPRVVSSGVSHTFTRACTRTLRALATDDDGGTSPTRSRTVVALGNSTTRRSTAWWSAEYRGATAALSAADRTCLLSTARTLSSVFAEKRALTTSAQAAAVLRPAAPASARSTFDARLLAAWLDVATGSVALGAPLDADRNGTAETTVGAFLLAAEHTRNASSATSKALPPLTAVLTRITTTG